MPPAAGRMESHPGFRFGVEIAAAESGAAVADLDKARPVAEKFALRALAGDGARDIVGHHLGSGWRYLPRCARCPVGVQGIRRTVAAYVALTKPRIIELLLVTTFPAMVVAAKGLPDLWLTLATLLGGSMAAGAR